MTTSDIILHHYEISPFSEKVRIAFGIKALAWRACEQPIINPKPELAALTGGYRRIPVLQIGADLIFDSTLILEELDRRFPAPRLCRSHPGLPPMLLAWCEGEYFQAIVGALFAGDWDADAAFLEDRSALIGRPFDPSAMAAALPQSTAEIGRHLAAIDLQLSDGRRFLTGAAPDAVDAMVFAQNFLARSGNGRTAALIDRHPRIVAWEERVRAIGHGKRGPDITPDEAIATARASVPAPLPDRGNSGLEARPGDRVRFRYADANSPLLEGELLRIDARALSIERDLDGGGRINIHLPRTIGQLAG